MKAITVLPRAQTSPLDVLRSLWRRWRQGAGDPHAPQSVPRLRRISSPVLPTATNATESLSAVVSEPT